MVSNGHLHRPQVCCDTVHALLQACEECRAIAAAGDAAGQAGLLQAQVSALGALAALIPTNPQ
jgi:hypothetical protein